MDAGDRRLLKLIAISTTFIAVVLALGIVLAIVGVILVHTGGHTDQVITGRMPTSP